MDPIKDFEQEISQVLKACEHKVSRYPISLNTIGYSYLEKQDMLSKKERRNSICYLLPFWLKDKYGLSMDDCRLIAEANAFGLLYFFTQDEVMDAPVGEYKGDLLPLSNLFNLELLSGYRALFPSNSVFWTHYDKYLVEWAASVTWERQEHLGCCKAYCEDDLLLLARKAAPLKIPAAAMSLLGNRERDISLWEKLIDYYHIVIQLVDDWRDWKDDLRNNNCNYFISKVAELHILADFSKLDETLIKRTILVSEVPEELFKTAISYCEKVSEICNSLDASYFIEYINIQKKYCIEQIKILKDEKNAIYQGGLYHFFYKHGS